MHIVLVAPEIPYNTGAVGRICVCLGARLHLVRPLGFSLEESRVKRSGLDYWPHVDIHVHDTWDDFLEGVHPARLHFASSRGERSLYDTAFSDGDALVFGNESSGLPPDFYNRYRDALFRIPMPGPHSRTLNLANAVSVVAYEAYRQGLPK